MLGVIRQRRSIRKYLQKVIEKEKLNDLLKAAMFSPTARGLRPWEFIVVTNNETRQQLSKTTPYAGFATEAPVIIIICYDMTKGKRFKEDCSICAENIYLEATNQGLGTCFIQIAEGTEGSVGEPETFVKNLLSIPEQYRVQCLMPIGYPEKQPEPHKDDEFEESRIHYEKF